MNKYPLRCIAVAALSVCSCFSFAKAHSSASKSKPPGYAVASASSYATNAGMAILKAGGNAFDAAIAVSAVLGVTEPYHSGIGGGGFWLLYNAKTKRNVVVDGREVAPQNATPQMYWGANQKPIKDLSMFGALAAAIPSEPAALAHIAKKYGRLPLTKTLAPAIKLAREGFVVDEAYRQTALNKRIHKHLLANMAAAKVFLPGGKVPEAGAKIIQKDLAKTLTKLAKEGAKGFYQGPVAERLVREVRRAGGVWTLADLKNYQVKERNPLVGHYKDMTVITTPPPSAGGVALITMLNILNHYSLQKMALPQKVHTIVEAMRLAYWDRSNYLGDPDFFSVPIKRLISKRHAKLLRSFIKDKMATASHQLTKKSLDFHDSSMNTTHFSIIDGEGNRVAATLSINYLFGSSFMAEGTGVLLNNEMDDFAAKVGNKNAFGLVGGKANIIEPGKRPLSSMSPTFLITPNRIALIGTPGGSRIPTMLLLSTLAFAEGKTAMFMVSQPRYHHQYLPDTIQYEGDALDADTITELTEMGYRLEKLNQAYGGRNYFYGDMQVVEWNKKNNALLASSDPRHVGLAQVHYNSNKPR